LVLGIALLSACRGASSAADSSAAVRDSSPASTVAQYLDAVREGARNPAVADSLLGCQMADGMYQPIEMLASFRLLSGVETATPDTAIVHAEVVTVAEEDGSPSAPGRFVARLRFKRDTVVYRLVQQVSRATWVLCTGPRYGFWGTDQQTDWEPPGASAIAARRLADSVWQAEHRPPSRPGA
jgi:hypothetical protein